MSDLIERLRDIAHASRLEWPVGDVNALYEAADELERLRAELAKCQRETQTLRNVAVSADERAERAEAERDALRSIILWALGENGEFPARPEDWEQRKHKPWYWWRTEMRNKFDAAMQRDKEQSND